MGKGQFGILKQCYHFISNISKFNESILLCKFLYVKEKEKKRETTTKLTFEFEVLSTHEVTKFK